MKNIENFIEEQIQVLEDKLTKKIGNIIENSCNNYLGDINNKVKEKCSQIDELISNKIHNALEDIDFKEFKDKKDKIISTLKNFQKKIDDYDFDSKKNETFHLFKTTIINEVLNAILEAIYSTEMGKYYKDYIEKYNNILLDASKIID